MIKDLCEVSLPHVYDHYKPIKLYDSSSFESQATEAWRFFITCENSYTHGGCDTLNYNEYILPTFRGKKLIWKESQSSKVQTGKHFYNDFFF